MQRRTKQSSDLSAWLAQFTARTHQTSPPLRWPITGTNGQGSAGQKRVLQVTATRVQYRLTGLLMTPGGAPGLKIARPIPTSARRATVG
jgi:hypothetical protein